MAAGFQYGWFPWPPGHAVTLTLRECWCCGSPRVRYFARGPLCTRCYNRWWRKGFGGPGPGPNQKPRQADSAREYEHVITSLSARRAAERLRVTPRTIVRWRAALREAS